MMGKMQIIHEVSQLLNWLPKFITKEELMNAYLHDIKIKRNVEAEITVVNLVQAANLANIRVKGTSRLEVNVTPVEQWGYIKADTGNGKTNKAGFREKLINNKEEIAKAYEGGMSIKEIAKAWGCAETTIRTYLISFGVKMRKAGKKKILEDGIIREMGTERKRRGKKRE